MAFESRKQALAGNKKFLIRMFKYMLMAGILVFVSAVIGTLGYMHFADLGLVDSFHMSCLILTGMGPVVEMKTTAAKLFSSFYALYSGVAFLSITAVFFAPLVHRFLHVLHLDEKEED
jgi:hypothetical protein